LISLALVMEYQVTGNRCLFITIKNDMETEKSIMTDILSNTLQIQEQFPELSKYILEMPVTIPDSNYPEITIESLKEYNDSLRTLLVNYSRQHLPVKK
jgi:hypothetical protein